MKFSSSFKVGLLTLLALVLLIGVVYKVKGRTFSSAGRTEVIFKDVNGMRPGAGVQMMGLRVGQVEEITPVIDGENSYVKVKFVITEPNIEIPKASMLSIQQSGLIGELFLEITPPKTRTVYIPMLTKDILYIEKKDSLRRRQVQTVLYHYAKTMMKLLSPVLVFTAEELHDHFHCDEDKAESVFLESNPQLFKVDNADAIKTYYDRFLVLRKDVMKALEDLRNEKVIKSNMEAKVTLCLKDEYIFFWVLNLIKYLKSNHLMKIIYLIIIRLYLESF